jgi:signal transduction histidine kinase
MVEEILIVDDQPSNLGLLSRVLTENNFRVRAVTSGQRALEAARLAPPDCMLLDVNMPGMDGYSVCDQFQSDGALRMIPIVFLTAHDDSEHKVRAFECGGRDYVSKPFQPEEVVARVRNQLRIKQLEAELREQRDTADGLNARLQEASALKARVTTTLVHDIRNPLMVIGSILSGPFSPRDLRDARDAYGQIEGMLKDLLQLSRSDYFQEKPPETRIYLNELLQRVVRLSDHIAQERGIRLTLAVAPEQLTVCGSVEELERVFANLVGNALKFTKPSGHVTLRVTRVEGVGVERGLTFAQVSVSDTGPGIPAEDLPFIFDAYRQTAGGETKGGVGLGLAIAARIVARHGGRIRALSQVGVGTDFRVDLPM